jgi:hypothetical protein
VLITQTEQPHQQLVFFLCELLYRAITGLLQDDGVSGPATGVLAVVLSPRGTIVSYAAMSYAPISISPLEGIFKPLNLRGFWLGHPEFAAKIPAQHYNARAWGADFAELRREAHDAATTLGHHRISLRPSTIDAQEP